MFIIKEVILKVIPNFFLFYVFSIVNLLYHLKLSKLSMIFTQHCKCHVLAENWASFNMKKFDNIITNREIFNKRIFEKISFG